METSESPLMAAQRAQRLAPRPFIAAIHRIRSRGCTALFDGWRAGAQQVAEQLDPAALNRVLLLSDGHANQGLTQRG